MWKKYELELQMTGQFAASLPRSREEIKAMLENRMPVKPPVDYIPIDELTEEVYGKVAPVFPDQSVTPAGEEEEELQYGWATFCRNEEGLYYEGRCVRGHLKDCANQVKDVDIPALKVVKKKDGEEGQITALKAKVANKVYVMTDVIPLMLDGVQAKEIAGTQQRFVQVMTRMGPRSTIKYLDYLEKPVLTFQLNVLDDGIITEDILDAIFEYGSVHGLGQERSQGWGRYTYTIKELK